jgi:hypothetical protein
MQQSSKRRFFHQEIALKFEEENNAVVHLEHRCVWYWGLDTSINATEKVEYF